MSDKNQMVDTSSHSSDLANSTYKKSRQSSGTENNEKDANSPQNDRGAWDNKLEYLLSSIGYAVGLGNVWRFPYLCFKNGGGAFLLPYLILLALCGLPIFLLENSLGQFSSQGPTRAYNGQPIMKGIGFAMIIVSSMVAPYYNIILSWIMYYIWRTLAAFKEGKLPWVDCEEEYGIRCVTREESAYCKSNLEFMLNSCTEFEKEFKVKRHTAIVNVNTEGHELNTECLKNSEFSTAFNDFFTPHDKSINCNEYALRQPPAEFFFEKQVLGLPDRPDFNHTGGIVDNVSDLGGINWHLFITLFISWIIVGFSIIKGVKSTGKTMYVTATFPYLVLTILLFKGVGLKGAWNGISFFLKPVTSKLGKPAVWKDAATQIFYSLSVSWGGLLTLSSYNPFTNNLIKDTYIVVCANSGTSIYAGIAIFAYLGYLADTLGLSIEAVVSKGPGFAFVVWPEAMSHISTENYICAFFSLIFFIMLYSLGLSTMVVTVETVVTSILDIFTNLRNERIKVVGGLILVNFLIGIPMITSRGLYWFTIFDDYAASYAVICIAIMEMISVSWIYGIDRVASDIKMMTNQTLPTYFKLAWKFITPGLLIVMLLFNIFQHRYSNFEYYGVDYYVHSCTRPLAVFLVFTPLCVILALAIREIRNQDSSLSFSEKLQAACSPTRHWGPLNDDDRVNYNQRREDDLEYQRHDAINGQDEEKFNLKSDC